MACRVVSILRILRGWIVPKKSYPFSRRELLTLIGSVAGGAAMYQAMSTLGFAEESTYRGAIRLEGAAKGTSVLILGAGIAGMLAAYELRNAGYQVQILEYNQRAGGRCWSLRGGDEYTELGGFKQRCEFDKDLYLNPGPWRIPYHHHAILDYCKRLGVALEPFIQVNYNAYVHAPNAYGGKPQRYRHVQSDYQGHVAELLAKAVNASQLDMSLATEDLERLLESLKEWGALDSEYRYRMGVAASQRRGFEVDAGGGLMPLSQPSEPLELADLLQSRLWSIISQGQSYEMQTSLFQPVGGMDMIAKAFAREVGGLIQFGAKVSKIDQDPKGVTVTYTDTSNGDTRVAKADWCVCTIPLSILSQLRVTVGAKMKSAIDAVPYMASVKAGLQFKRRFWEEDDRIYGGITYTDLPPGRISYPVHGMNGGGKGVLLGAYMFGPDAYKFTAMEPAERLRKIVDYGAQIHPQYKEEFENGITVGWSRVPWVNGCAGWWSEGTRAAHYRDLCEIDGRVVLAGEHASYVNAWQEGAALSALDAIDRLHQRIVAS
jgi:monoamine oxidase